MVSILGSHLIYVIIEFYFDELILQYICQVKNLVFEILFILLLDLDEKITI